MLHATCPSEDYLGLIEEESSKIQQSWLTSRISNNLYQWSIPINTDQCWIKFVALTLMPINKYQCLNDIISHSLIKHWWALIIIEPYFGSITECWSAIQALMGIGRHWSLKQHVLIYNDCNCWSIFKDGQWMIYLSEWYDEWKSLFHNEDERSWICSEPVISDIARKSLIVNLKPKTCSSAILKHFQKVFCPTFWCFYLQAKFFLVEVTGNQIIQQQLLNTATPIFTGLAFLPQTNYGIMRNTQISIMFVNTLQVKVHFATLIVCNT